MVFLLEAYNMPPSESMDLPSSRRHRLVKIREEIVRSKGKPKGTQPYATGINPSPRDPSMMAAHQASVDRQKK